MSTDHPHDNLLGSIKTHLPELEKLLVEINGHWGEEDLVYRFYHGSFKAYRIQWYTRSIMELFQKISKELGLGELNQAFIDLISKGIDKNFKMEHNKRWNEEVCPLFEAFWHAKYFLEMACKYAKELEKAPSMLPSGWASVLYLFNLR